MEQKYVAFISYRHVDTDSQVAKELHSRIEQYTIPKGLRKDGKKLGKVFRDLEELPASSNLSEDIYRALDNSENLIVVCSRAMTESPWVAREVEYFLQHHSQDKVYTVLVDGEPGEVFPKALLRKTLPDGTVEDVEPLAVDVRTDGKTDRLKKLRREVPRLLAAMIGCPYDALIQRQQRRQRRRLLLGASAVLALALLFSGVMLVKNRQIDAKNRELEQVNQQLQAQKEELQLRESERLSKDAQEWLETGDLGLALPLALEALWNEDGNMPYYGPAENALIASLGIFDDNGEYLLVDTELSQPTPIEHFEISGSGDRLATIDPYGTMYCFDTATGGVAWKWSAEPETIMIVNGDQLLLLEDNRLMAMRFADGELLWQEEYTEQGAAINLRFGKLTPDGKALLCVGEILSADNLTETYVLLKLSTTTGQVENTAYMAQCPSGLSAVAYPYIKIEKLGAVSADGRYLVGCWREVTSSEAAVYHMYLVDLQTFAFREIYSIPVEAYASADEIYSIDIQDSQVYVLRGPQQEESLATAECWDIAAGKQLWQSQCLTEDFVFSAGLLNHCTTFTGKSMGISCGQHLYWLDRQTGQLLMEAELEAEATLFEAQPDSIFQVMLENGRMGFVWANSVGLNTIFPARLWEHTQFALYDGGFLSLPVENGRVGDVANGGAGYTVCLTKNDERKLVVSRSVNAGQHFPEQAAAFHQEDDGSLHPYIWKVGGGKLIMGPISLLSGEAPYQRFVLFDPAKPDQQTSLYAGSQYCAAEDLLFTADGRFCLECEGNGNVRWFDTATGQETLLSERETVELFSAGDTGWIASRYITAAATRYDGVTVAARMEETGLTLWLDGQEQKIAAPDGAVLQTVLENENSRVFSQRLLWVGENGCVVASGLPDTQTLDPAFLWIYDTVTGQWSRLDVQTDLLDVKMAPGKQAHRLVLLDREGIAWVYDTDSGMLLNQVDTIFPQTAIRQLETIEQDRYLLVRTDDKQMAIFDLETAEMVDLRQLESHAHLTAAEDGKGRLYISWQGGGVCLETDGWAVLAQIPDMIGYDATTDQVICKRFGADSFEEELFFKTLPDREELIRIARELLGK